MEVVALIAVLKGKGLGRLAQADAEQAAQQQRKALERTMEPGEAAGSSDRALARQNLSVTDGDTSPDRTDSLRPEGDVAPATEGG